MGPPPEVIFSDPAEGEIDVPLRAPVRLQFSREMNPDTFKGNVRWTFTTVDAVNVGASTPREAERQPEFKYDRAKRALEIRLALDDSATYRERGSRTARWDRRDRRREAQALAADVRLRRAVNLHRRCPLVSTQKTQRRGLDEIAWSDVSAPSGGTWKVLNG